MSGGQERSTCGKRNGETIDYNVSEREFHKAPEAPLKEQLSEPTEYEQAVQTFE